MSKMWNQKEYAKVARRAAAEGVVLLRNENGVLPLKEKNKIAVFGRNQLNYYKSGTGSGGGVNVDYVIGIYEALEECGKYVLNQHLRSVYEEWGKEHPFDAGRGWASEPWFQKEMPLSLELIKQCEQESEIAIILIGRTAGEDQDNKNEKGSFLLTDDERDMFDKVCSTFKKTIVLLNVGNIIDMRWVEEYKPSAVAYVWQGGQEGGNGVLDVLSGEVNPSGKLADTIATCIEDYPSTSNFGNDTENIHVEDIYIGYRYFETFAKEKVLYPFGFGLSYTSFKITMQSFTEQRDQIELICLVKNIGKASGKEVVQVYVDAPQGKLGKPARVLCGFAKTKELTTNEEVLLSFSIPKKTFASYDDSGITGQKSCYVLEAGKYDFYVGTDVRSAQCFGSYVLERLQVVEQCSEALAPVIEFKRLRPLETMQIGHEEVSCQTKKPQQKRLERLPVTYPYTGDKGYKLSDVADGMVSMEEFLAQLTDEDLCAMMRGEGMSSPKVTPGIAGAFGGITDRLLAFGIPIGGCADGPSGIRMDCGLHAFSLPNGTCLACTFNEKLLEELFQWEGLELRKNKIDTLLGPGMNIHRNPLNGRNFEYFSEDPFLTGKMAAAQLRGMHKYGVTGTIKHFASNTQEYKRNTVNSIVSERALREIYLKGFEIAVKEGKARSIMSTYGPINGIWTSGNYDLLTEILRGEWGFTGIVMTDWWAVANDEPGGEASLQNVAAQVRAQNDLNMVTVSAEKNSGEDNLAEALEKGMLSRGELQRSAANICRFLINTPAFLRMYGKETELDKDLNDACTEMESAFKNISLVTFDGMNADIKPNIICTEKGKTTCFDVNVSVRGTYQLELTLKATGGNELAQLPITIYKDQNVITTFTLKGSEVEWRKEMIPLGLVLANSFYLRFFFAQSGIEIKEAKIVLLDDYTERIRKYLETRE